MATTIKQTTASRERDTANPLLSPWRTPFGLPPFDRVEPAHFGPAFDKAFALHNAEIRKVSDNTAKATFANTIVALEKSGVLLTRICDLFFNQSSAHTNAALQSIERDIAPRLADHQSAMFLDAGLFRRIDDLWKRRDNLRLQPEQLRILERTHTAFVRAGAELDANAKTRIAEINGRLATLITRFGQNVLADEQAWHMLLDGEADLGGLPASVRAAAYRASEQLGYPGKYAITLARSSVEPFLQFCDRRHLREEAFKAWISRGESGGTTDNRGIVAEVMSLRAELARLMGFSSFADYALEDTMAKTPDAVRGLLRQVWPAALSRAVKERDALALLSRKEGDNFKIEAWDWRYLAEKERKARFDLDDNEIRPYLQLDNMIAAAFDTASRLFGLSFVETPDVPRYHPDVRVWEVRDSAGEHVGIFLGDYFARPSKRSGAWMSSYRSQHQLGGNVRPVIVNVMNFARGADGLATLLSFDDARTLFHEFGHGLHGLLSDVTYPSLSGTNVARDFVELPSQLYEHWLSRPEVLKRYALHCESGKPMPDSLIERLQSSRTFNQGFQTVEYTAAALIDMELHGMSDPGALDVVKFEAEALARLGMPSEIVMRHRIPHFQHIMGGYAAGYYSYLWSEVMDADAFSAFEESGDVFDAGVAARLKLNIYASGNTRDPLESYVAFRGREPHIESLLKKRGLNA